MNPVAVAVAEAGVGIEIGTMTGIETEIEIETGKWEEMQEWHSVQITRITVRQK